MGITTEVTKGSYIWAFVIIFVVTLASIMLLLLMQPERDHTQEIIYIVGLMAPTTASIMALLKTQETHMVVNSRIDEFKATLNKLAEAQIVTSRAEGVVQGRKAADARTDQLAGETPMDPKSSDYKAPVGGTTIKTGETVVINKKQ